MHEGIISTWWGQSRVVKKMVEEGCESALVLEDDVDVEWEIERAWKRVEGKLPREWGVVMLGHCWSHEILCTFLPSSSYLLLLSARSLPAELTPFPLPTAPQYLHPHLHPSVSPMCLHGWALSRHGAQLLLPHLQNPWSSYSTAVDLLLPTLLSHHALPAYSTFSLQPPLVIQRKDSPSDLQKGSGSKWRGALGDSTWERVRRDEGTWRGSEEVGEVWREEEGRDPATVFREVRNCV